MANYLISTLAEYQTRFWIPVAEAMSQSGHDVALLSFDQRSTEMIAEAGLRGFDATPPTAARLIGDQDPGAIVERFGIDRVNYWLTHERFAFDLRDGDALLAKLAGALLAADHALAECGPGVMLVQELGGFLSVIGSHFAALARGAPSWFIEPSFFRGRALFLEGDLGAVRLPAGSAAEPGAEVADYLDRTVANSAIVIPEKDRHQYTTAFRKVVNVKNAVRLAQKVVDKHLLGKHQEFGHIGSHVSRHLGMIRASRKLAGHYTPLESLGRFVYYPLHVPGDMALTLRSPEYLDQFALVDYLCRVAPHGVRVAVKEHPAMIGAMGSAPLLQLQQRYDHFAIIAPGTNNYEVLSKAEAVVTVNSKSGAEAGLVGKPVIVLGDAFYREAPFARAIDAIGQLGSALDEVLSARRNADPASTRAYFGALWPLTFPGELYVTDPDNVARFARSTIAATRG